jgi:hypothetical protein
VPTFTDDPLPGVYLPDGQVEYKGLDHLACPGENCRDELLKNALLAARASSSKEESMEWEEQTGMPPTELVALNELLAPVEFVLPKLEELRFDEGGSDAMIELESLLCKDVQIGKAWASSVRRSSTMVEFNLGISNLGLHCVTKYKWGVLNGFFNGDGWADLKGWENAIDVSLEFSSDTERGMPTKAEFSMCKANIGMNAHLYGSVQAWFVNLFAGPLIGMLNGLINDLICAEVVKLGPTLLSDNLIKFGGMVGPY